MTVVTILEAQKSLARLIAKANKGQEIIITRGKTPVAKLIAVRVPSRKRAPGRLKGKLRAGPKVFERLPAEECAQWGIE
ncbi:MAG: type II toxin-antitoxin system Phd/YefM family antitoxin [Candidatus Acidiferrales bacterium]